MDEPDDSYAPQSPDLSEYHSSSYAPPQQLQPPQGLYYPNQSAYQPSYQQHMTISPTSPYSQSMMTNQEKFKPLPSPNNGRMRMDADDDDDWAPVSAAPKSGRKSKKPKIEEHYSKPAPGVEEGIEVKTKFPVARIKRIMQADEDVGKVAQVTPTAVSKALELFMISMVTKAADEARAKSSKRVVAAHLKQVVQKDVQFDFLAETVAKVPDAPASKAKKEGTDSEDTGEPKKKRGAEAENVASASDSPSVNDLIQRSRHSHGPSAETRAHDASNIRTVHPSLKAILQVPDTPSPRPRPGMSNVGGRRARGVAGPAPPMSWLETSMHCPSHMRKGCETNKNLAMPQRLNRLPGIYLPKKESLQHCALLGLARNWPESLQFEHEYLADLPIRLKQTLLSYIAVHFKEGVGLRGLETIFLDRFESEPVGLSGNDLVTHLDLSCFSEPGLSFKELMKYFSKKPLPNQDAAPASSNAETIPDTWDQPSEPIPRLMSGVVLRFPSLTHLSLSNWKQSNNWRSLLNFAPQLTTLTHLSLAYWPIPSLTPNSITASITSPVGNVDYGASNFYSHGDGDWDEAVGILKRLGKRLTCLKWLDLEGCKDWHGTLSYRHDKTVENACHELWNGSFSSIETVRIGRGSPPLGLEVRDGILQAGKLFDDSVASGIRHWISTRHLCRGSERDEINETIRTRVRFQEWISYEKATLAMESRIKKIRRAAGGKGIGFERVEGYGVDERVLSMLEQRMEVRS